MAAEDNSTTPKLYSTIIESLMRIQVKHMHRLTFRVADKEPNLHGPGYDETGADEKIAQLDSWVNSIIPITLNSISTLEDNKTVYPEPVPVRKIKKVTKEDTEWYVCQISLIGL